MSLRLPESIHRRLGELAEREGISINQFINSAVAEKLAALMTEAYLRERAERASAQRFDAVLAKLPDTAPAAEDEIPQGYRRTANDGVKQRERRKKAG